MAYSIVYSSHTGNTAMLAEAVKEAVSTENCLYFGGPDVEYIDTPLIFIGFWTNKGTCDGTAKAFLKTLKNKSLFLFGTAGFGGSKEYYKKIMDDVQQNIHASNKVIGTYMCQGKMPITVRTRYENMLATTTVDSNFKDLIDNYDHAASHPDLADRDNLKQQVIKTISNL